MQIKGWRREQEGLKEERRGFKSRVCTLPRSQSLTIGIIINRRSLFSRRGTP